MMTSEEMGELLGERRVDLFAAMLQKRGKGQYRGVTKGVAARLPLHVVARLNAMARMASIPLSSVIYQLLEVGMQETDAKLPASTFSELTELHQQEYERLGGEAAEYGEV